MYCSTASSNIVLKVRCSGLLSWCKTVHLRDLPVSVIEIISATFWMLSPFQERNREGELLGRGVRTGFV
jgi:hypothetical protein